MTTPHSPGPTNATSTATADTELGSSVRLAAAGVLEATALDLGRVLTRPDLTLDQVIDAGRAQDDFTLDDAVATITHLVLTCLAHVHQGRGLLDGLPDLPAEISTLTDCLQLVDHEVATWTTTVIPPDIDPDVLRSAARGAVDAAARELS